MVYAWSENFVLPLSHDEVVHGKGTLIAKMPGDGWQKFANLRAYYAFMWGYPGKKLLFMGQEFAQGAEWSEARSLDWWQLDLPPHRGVQSLVRDLNHLYAAKPALHARDCEPDGFDWLVADDADRSIYAWVRKAPGENPVAVVSNMTPVPREGYGLALPAAGRWREILNTDATAYGGSGARQHGRRRRHRGRARDGRARHPAASGDDLARTGTGLRRRTRIEMQGGEKVLERHTSPLARDAMAYVLAGGRGSRLKELTDRRAKPAVYFGGKTRIIDFALSNALNSGIRRIGVATQYKAHSLIRHLQRGWDFFRPERNESFDILPASQRVSETQWYEGTADAVYQNLDIIADYEPEFMVILAGDHIYKMDYELMLQQHVEQGADVTVGCLEVPRMEATGFGVMHVDEKDMITAFVEKPADPPGIPGQPDMALASMGIYVFRTKFLADLLRRDAETPGSSRDFGKDLIPYIVQHGKAVAHRFGASCVRSSKEAVAYWRDVGTVDAYWEANIDLTDIIPELDLYDTTWPIWTYAEIKPPAKFVHDVDGRRGSAVSSLVAGDCIISGASIRRSLVSTGVRAHSYTSLDEAVILPDVDIGRGARLRRVVVDRGVRIPDGLIVGDDPGLDEKRFRRSEGGICLITQPMIDSLGA